MKRHIGVLLFAGAVVASLVACGGSDSETPDARTQAPDAHTQVSEETQAPDETLAVEAKRIHWRNVSITLPGEAGDRKVQAIRSYPIQLEDEYVIRIRSKARGGDGSAGELRIHGDTGDVLVNTLTDVLPTETKQIVESIVVGAKLRAAVRRRRAAGEPPKVG